MDPQGIRSGDVSQVQESPVEREGEGEGCLMTYILFGILLLLILMFATLLDIRWALIRIAEAMEKSDQTREHFNPYGNPAPTVPYR